MTEQELALDQARQKYEKLLELANKYGQDTTVITEKYQAQVGVINEKYKEKEVEIEELTQEAKLAMASKGVGIAIGLFGEESKAGKALAVGQALINTYSAATAALAPPPIGAGPILGPLAAVGAVAAGMANVKKIMSTDLPDVTDDGGGGGGAPDIPETFSMGALTPNMEAINQPTLGGSQPVQAFVVESNISNAQALQEELDVQATL